MKFNYNKIIHSNSINQSLKAKDVKMPIFSADGNDFFLESLINEMKEAKTSKDVIKLLFDKVHNTDQLKEFNGIRFQHKAYNIENFYKADGAPYERNLKTLNDLDLSIVPKHIDTIEKDGEYFVITKLPQTETGEIIQLRAGTKDVSKEQKIDAYNDLQKLTKAGYVDDNVLNSDRNWFCSKDKHNIIIPDWSKLRPITSSDSTQSILTNYYNKLFG